MSKKQNKQSEINVGNLNNASNLNIGGEQTFHGDVTITINHGQLNNAPSDPTRDELKSLLEQLEAALKDVPAEHAEDAELVQEYANDAAEEAAKEQPRQKKLEITGENLKKAAENLLAVSPIAVKIAHVLLQIPV